MTNKEIKEKLKDCLKPDRYRHVLGVAAEAKRLAELYGADEDKAYTAGLLHDCAKGFSIDEQKELCAELSVPLDDAMLQCPAVIHGFLGAELARERYGIADTEIINAIKYHTVGRAGMSLLEKIVYIADMTEKNRSFDGVRELRRAVDVNLDEALVLCIGQQLKLQCGRRRTIHPNIIYMWNDLIANGDLTENKERK